MLEDNWKNNHIQNNNIILKIFTSTEGQLDPSSLRMHLVTKISEVSITRYCLAYLFNLNWYYVSIPKTKKILLLIKIQ